jgi:hypothetical protein
MNEYEAKQEAKRERLKARAARARRESESAGRAAKTEMDGIPMGQPILVGHHSEKRHRRALDRIDRNMHKAVEKDKEAKRLESRAASVGSGGISSDDPDAVEKLRTRLANLEGERERMKAINAAWRKAKRPAPDDTEGWRTIADAVGMSDNDLHGVRKTMAMDPLDRGPFPNYALQNIGGNITRIKKRIQALEAAERVIGKETRHEDLDLTVHENEVENRIQLRFSGKPSPEVRQVLKSAGFRWAPSQGSWQRHLNSAGRLAAEMVLTELRRKADAGSS